MVHPLQTKQYAGMWNGSRWMKRDEARGGSVRHCYLLEGSGMQGEKQISPNAFPAERGCYPPVTSPGVSLVTPAHRYTMAPKTNLQLYSKYYNYFCFKTLMDQVLLHTYYLLPLANGKNLSTIAANHCKLQRIYLETWIVRIT